MSQQEAFSQHHFNDDDLESVPCTPWRGSSDHYQEQAILSSVEADVQIFNWSWPEPTCGTDLCLEPGHIRWRKPAKLHYPYGICIYCGRGGFTKDHLLPKAWTGLAVRRHVITVPACGECNSFITDKWAPSITERREIAQLGIRRKYAAALNAKVFTFSELQDFGPGLRPTIAAAMETKRTIMERLEWPDDHTFDLRYLGDSGIDDPYVAGLLIPVPSDLHQAWDTEWHP